MAENSRKNEFFERESIAMIAITTSNSISVKLMSFMPVNWHLTFFFEFFITYLLLFG